MNQIDDVTLEQFPLLDKKTDNLNAENEIWYRCTSMNVLNQS